MNLKRVVVTGLGALTPLGNNVQDYWNGLINGVSGAGPITRFDASKFKTKFACEVKNFTPTDYLDRKEIRKMDLFTVFALVASQEAFANSGLDTEKINRDRAGVIWGSGIGGLKTFQDEAINFNNGDGTPRFNPFFIPKMIADISAGYISIKYGFRGPNFATVSACASATNALVESFNYIRLGKADVMISGGSEASIVEAGVGGFNALRALSERNDSPETASRPFDKDRDGFVLGEGGGALILEELEHAQNRGAHIFAELVGGGLSADAHHITAPHPEGLGAILVMKNALEDAQMQPEEIDYVNVHGTSTPLGDISEARAMKKVFGDHAYKINISSTKSMTGHLLGAAGAVEAAITALSISKGIITPTINLENPDPECDLNIATQPVNQDINTAISNSFGFGGVNAVLVLKKYQN